MTKGINDFRPDDWEVDGMMDDDEPEHVCSCNAMHDDLEYAENLCSACGLMIYDPWAPAQESSSGKEDV